MTPSGALIQQSEDASFRGGDSIFRPVLTVHCTNLSVVHSSGVYGPALQDIKCKEEQVDYNECSGIGDEEDVIIDSPSVEHAKKNTKKGRRDKMKSVSTKREIDGPASKSDGFPKQDTSLTSEGSPFTFEALCDDNRKDTVCSKEETKGTSSNSPTRNSEDGLSSGDIFEGNSCKTMDIKSYCNGCGSGTTKSRSQCCNADNVVTVNSDAVDNRHHCQIWRGKENSPVNWQKSQGNFRAGKLHGVSRLDCANVKEDMILQERNFCAQNNSIAGKGLLPTPMVACAGHLNVACVSNSMANKERKILRGFTRKEFIRHDLTPKHRLYRNHSPYFSLSNQAHEIESDKSRLFSQCSFGCERNHSRGIGWGGYGQVFSKPITTHGSSCINPSSAASAPGQQRFMRWVPRMNHVTDRCSDTSVNGRLRSRLKYCNEYRARHVVHRGVKAMWVPVCSKDSVMPENTYTASVCDSYDISQISCNVLTDSYSKGDAVPLCVSASLTDSKRLSLTCSHRKISVEGEGPKSKEFSVGGEALKSKEFSAEGAIVESDKEDMACTEKSRDVSHFLGSKESTEESNAARKLQLEYQSTLGHPIPEFERFLHSAAPVVTSSCTYKNQQLTSSFHQTQLPTISLQDVWQWYEKPGSYGLEVKARDSQNINGLLAESTPFCAYFVPSLSAVQFFGYPHLSDACRKDTVHTNPELIFEFFESEPPHVRKPLHLKIKDLINVKISNLQVFGDPSKLESMNLHDLHPASWFSVAWYPICRIPERKFQAAFLTYHSFGLSLVHSIPIGSLSKMAQMIVFPVIGLQSNKTKGECWFDRRTPVESSSEENTSSRTSEILGGRQALEERRRTLEKNAKALSTESVTKDQVKRINHHPDYEFFIRRNH